MERRSPVTPVPLRTFREPEGRTGIRRSSKHLGGPYYIGHPDQPVALERRSERSYQQQRPVWVMPRIPALAYPAPASSAPIQLTPAETHKWQTTFFVNRFPSPVSATHLTLLISFQLLEREVPVTTIVDSGAYSCFIDLTFATQHLFLLRSKVQGLSVFLADGSSIKSRPVTQETLPLPVLTTSQHKEILSLDAIASPLFPVILGLPWLRAHNPQVDWATGQIYFHSAYYQEHCLPGPSVPPTTLFCMD